MMVIHFAFIILIAPIDALRDSTTSYPWHYGFTLKDNTTVLGWNDNNFKVSSSSPSLCLTIDQNQGLHCMKTSNNYQHIPFSLIPGEHFVHISQDMSTTPTEIATYIEPYNATDGLRVMFLSPAYGTTIELDDIDSEIAKTSLEVFFTIIDTDNLKFVRDDGLLDSSNPKLRTMGGFLPSGTMMVINLSDQGEFIVQDQAANNFVLSGIEPATHRITAQVVDQLTRTPLGAVTELVIEATFSPRVLARHQYTTHHINRKGNVETSSSLMIDAKHSRENILSTPNKETKSSPSKVKNVFSQLFNIDTGVKGDSSVVLQPTQNKEALDQDNTHVKNKMNRKIRLTFVGTLKYDGQRAIWLHQMNLLKRDEFDITMVTFTRDNHDKPVLDLLKQYNIKLVVAPFPPIQNEEIAQSLAQHYNAYIQASGSEVKSGGGDMDDPAYPFWLKRARESTGMKGPLTETELDSILPRSGDEVNYYLLGFLKEAGGQVEKITVDWIKRCWIHCISTLQQSHQVEEVESKIPGNVLSNDHADLIKKVGGDLLVFANARDNSDVFLAEAGRLSGAHKVVVDLPNLFPDKDLKVDVMVAPSHYVSNHPSVIPFTENNATQVVVINPGVNLEVFHPAPPLVPIPTALDEGGEKQMQEIRKHIWTSVPVIGFLARFSPEKSPGLFLTAARAILRKWPFAKFVVIGRGDLELKGLVNRLGIAKSVTFLGGIFDPHLLASEVRSMTVVVNPSLRAWSETFCIANIEVMAAGVPVVSFGIGGVQEYLHDDQSSGDSIIRNGVIVHEATGQALADGVLWLLANRTRRENIAKIAQKQVFDKFSIEKEVESYRQLYISLLQ